MAHNGQIVELDTRAVVRHAERLNAALTQADLNPRRSGVDGVLELRDQLNEERGDRPAL